MDGAQKCVGDSCCDCWTKGCGCDKCFGVVADGLETVNPCMEYVADLIWCLGSPLAFPIVFCFDDGPQTDPPGGGWKLPMIQTPCRVPIKCCFYTACAPCGQWWMRRQLLEGDMSKYKLWQGYHDGPHCLARRCPGSPLTIQSGTYGEDKCPHAFLAAEVCFLGCMWSVCCSYDVNRRMMKEQRNLGNDPLENRVNNCVGLFSDLASKLCVCSMCIHCCSCCVGFCAPESAGAQECSGEGGRAARACCSCAHTCWRGIWSVKIIAMGCASSQMDYEMKEGVPLVSAPTKIAMERGMDDEESGNKWWEDPRKPVVVTAPAARSASRSSSDQRSSTDSRGDRGERERTSSNAGENKKSSNNPDNDGDELKSGGGGDKKKSTSSSGGAKKKKSSNTTVDTGERKKKTGTKNSTGGGKTKNGADRPRKKKASREKL